MMQINASPAYGEMDSVHDRVLSGLLTVKTDMAYRRWKEAASVLEDMFAIDEFNGVSAYYQPLRRLYEELLAKSNVAS